MTGEGFGWLVAGALGLVCLWLVWVIEKAYRTGFTEGQIAGVREVSARDCVVVPEADRLRKRDGR